MILKIAIKVLNFFLLLDHIIRISLKRLLQLPLLLFHSKLSRLLLMSKVLVNTHSIGNPPPNLDPPLLPPNNSIPPSNNLITTHTANSHFPHQ